ncbi:MAG TPA: hypothetical protein VH115_00810 [Solirubrobacteraceae bacterium]|nr:hypothetical protein [Solirubrobacteraceae bacterium]
MALATASACAIGAVSSAPLASGGVTAGPPLVSAALTQCVTSVTQSERSATFAGEMSAIPGTVRMAIRVDVEQRLPGEALFRTVVAPGASAWRTSETKVKLFKYLKQVTDLLAPARSRATVRFRWLNAHGATIRRASRVTKACEQPASPAPVGVTGS